MTQYHTNSFVYGVFESRAIGLFEEQLKCPNAKIYISEINHLRFRWQLEKKYNETACKVYIDSFREMNSDYNPNRFFEVCFITEKEADGVRSELLRATVIFRVEDPEKSWKPKEIILDAEDVIKSEIDSKQRHNDEAVSFLD